MKPLALRDIADATEGALHWVSPDVTVRAVSTDSRRVHAGDLFVCLPGERVDGHEFAAAAVAAGAVAVLTSKLLPNALPQIVCRDTQWALGRIAARVAAERTTSVLAITGSNGKTSVKTLLKGILSRVASSYANPGNLNNEIGLPSSLLAQPDDAVFGVYEMGAGKPGDIAYLCDVVTPQVALVNNIAAAHLERMGSMLGIAQTKGAIYRALPMGGVAVIAADEPFAPLFEEMASHARIVRFGVDCPGDVMARQIHLGATSSRFLLVTHRGSAQIHLPLAGMHNVRNALAAAAMALPVDVALTDIVAGLEQATAVDGRLQRHELNGDVVLIDDSYNANPGSLGAAIAVLAAQGANTCLVLGDMRELGPDALELHRDMGRQAKEAGIRELHAVGPLASAAVQGFGPSAKCHPDQQALIDELRTRMQPGLRCLIKGSRGSRMDRVVTALLHDHGEDTAHVA